MSLYKRYGNWYISLYTRSGKRVRYATGTQDRSLALQLHDEQKAKLWRQENLGEKHDIVEAKALIEFDGFVAKLRPTASDPEIVR